MYLMRQLLDCDSRRRLRKNLSHKLDEHDERRRPSPLEQFQLSDAPGHMQIVCVNIAMQCESGLLRLNGLCCAHAADEPVMNWRTRANMKRL